MAIFPLPNGSHEATTASQRLTVIHSLHQATLNADQAVLGDRRKLNGRNPGWQVGYGVPRQSGGGPWESGAYCFGSGPQRLPFFRLVLVCFESY